ncbi:MAG: hypothetical protein QM713_07830 [Arachnia sp.]
MSRPRADGKRSALFYWVYGFWLVVALIDTASNATTLFGVPLQPLTVASTGLLTAYALIRALGARFVPLELAGYFLCFILGLYALTASDFAAPLILILFLVAAKGADPERVARTTLVGTVIGLVLVFASYSAGLAHDVVIRRIDGGIDRHSFGFIHPNTLAAVLFNALMAWYLLYNRSTRLRYKLPLAGFVVFNSLFLDSRSTIFLGILLIVVWFGGRRGILFLGRHVTASLWVLLLVLVGALYLTMSFDPKIEWHSWFDSLFSARFALGKAYTDTYGLGLVGQEVQLGKISDPTLLARLEGSRGTVDAGYLHLALRAGLIVAACFTGALFVTFRRLARNGDVALAVCVALVILSGLFETTVFSVLYAFPLLAVGMVRWEEGSRWERGLQRQVPAAAGKRD